MEEWETNQSFQEAKLAVESFPVVNDAAERGVKLFHDQGQGLFCEKQQQNTKNTNNSRHRRNKRFSQGDKKKTEVFKSLSPAFQEKKCS